MRLRISIEIVDVKTVVVFVVVVLSVFLQSGIRAQPTIGSSSEDDSCSQLEEGYELQAVENVRLQSLLESERQTMKTLENVSYSQSEALQRLNQKLENKQQKIDKLENVSSDQTVENQQLNLALEKKQQKIETLENVSRARAEENDQLNMELEKKQQKIETLENASTARAGENHQLNMELEKKQQKIETLENVSSSRAEEIHRINLELENKQQMIVTLGNESDIRAEEIHRLNLELEKKQQKIDSLENERRRLRARGLISVTATFIGSLNRTLYCYGITTVENKIYVLEGSNIKVYEDMMGFRFIKDIALNGTKWLFDIVYSNKSKCVYISDYHENCIYMVTTTGQHRLTKWLTNVAMPYTLSLSNEGHLLVLRQSQSYSQDSLEIYSLNATLIRRLHLPQGVKDSRHVVQTLNGNFIIIHRLNNVTGPYVISQLTNDGQLINRFIPRNQSERLIEPRHLSLDSDNNRLLLADYIDLRVIVFDSNVLTWTHVLLSREMNGFRCPWRLFYDAKKKHLFVVQHYANLAVYEIN